MNEYCVSLCECVGCVPLYHMRWLDTWILEKMNKKTVLSMVINQSYGRIMSVDSNSRKLNRRIDFFRYAILFVLVIVIINLALVDSQKCKKKRRRFIMIVSENLFFNPPSWPGMSNWRLDFVACTKTTTAFASSPRYMPAGDTIQYTCHLCGILA